MGSIDIAEKRRPQDGRIKTHVAGQGHRPARQHPPDQPWPVGRHADPRPRQHQGRHPRPRLRRGGLERGSHNIIKRPNGIFLVTGPTGSGKTTTLYAALNELNRPDRKIITAEDPVEYYLPGINQCEVHGQDRHDLRPDHPRHAAAEPEHPPGRRNPRRGDGRHRNPGFSDWTLGFQYAAHERCAQRYYTSGRHRRPAVPGRPLGHGDHGPAAGAKSLPEVPASASSPPPDILQAIGSPPTEIAKKANFMKGKGCTHCNQTGYRGRMGIYRADDHDSSHPRDDVQGRTDPESPSGWPASRGCGRCSRTG